MHIQRLLPEQRESARALFALLSEVMEEGACSTGEAYTDQLLRQDSFWAVAAIDDDVVVGGLTGHTLPMTKAEQSEFLIYDLAVAANRQRQGIGQMLVNWVRNEAAAVGISTVFVLADNEDAEALAFYRKLGGGESPVTLFVWD